MAAAAVDGSTHLVRVVRLPVKENYDDPAIGARRREILTMFFDMLLVLGAMIVWFVVSAALMDLAP